MQKRKISSRITALLLAMFMLVAYMPLLGDAAYADTTVFNNSSSDHQGTDDVGNFANNYGVTIKSDKTEYNLGEDIHVKIEGATTAGAGNWVALYKSVSINSSTTTEVWAYTSVVNNDDFIIYGPNRDSSVTVNTDLSEGTYYIIVINSGDYEGRWAILPITIKISTPPVDPALTTDKDTYDVNEPIEVTASGGRWVGLYGRDENPEIMDYFCYFNTNGAEDVVHEFKASEMERTIKEGNYKIVLFGDSGYTNVLLSKNITIDGSIPDAEKEGYDLQLTNSTNKTRTYYNYVFEGGFCSGNDLTFKATYPETDTKAWVAVYQYFNKSSYNNDNGLRHSYVSADGTVKYDSLPDGQYKAVLFDNDGYDPAKTVYFYVLPHKYSLEKVEEVPATCTESGTAEYWTCSCGELLSSDANGTETIDAPEVIPALKHNMTSHPAVAKTCTTAGNSAYWFCDRCNKYFSDEEGTTEIGEDSWVIPASHNLVAHPKEEAACEEAGTEAYWTCSDCNKMFADKDGNTEIAEPKIIPATGHKYTLTGWTWEEDFSKATATFVCENDATHVETVETVPEIDKELSTAATCTEAGENDYIATVEFEGTEYSDDKSQTVAALDHAWDEGEVTTAPTCSAKGVKTFKCKNDPSHTKTEEIDVDKDAHDWGDWKVTKEATETEEGVETRTCKNDATHTETRAIPKKTPADSGDDEAVAKAKAELGTFIDEVSNLEQGDHSDAEYQALMTALESAKAVYDKQDATEEELKAATDALFEAEYKYIVGEEYKNEGSSDTDGKTIKTIIAKAKEKLQSIVEKAKQYINDKDKYTEESYKKFEDAVNKAIAAAEKADASVVEIENVKKAVTDAVKDLKEKEDSQTEEGKAAAKEALKKALEEARNAIKEATSDDSEQAGALREAIDKATKIFENDKATPTELAKALSDIENARKAYTEKKAAAEALNKTVEDAKKIEQGNYTDESFKALQDAIAEAEKVANDPKATSADLKAAEDKVTAAKAALKEKEAEPAKKVIKVGTVEKYKNNSYKVTSTKSKTASLKKAKNVKTVAIPATVKLSDGKTYKVTAVEASAFTAKKIRNVTLGKNVKKIKANAFKKSKATTVTLKTKLLKKSTVKNSLKGSVVKTVKVRITKKASSKTNKTYIKKYKKYFTKANAGRKVSVK